MKRQIEMITKMDKIFVRCYKCNKKMRLRKETEERPVYYLDEGAAKVQGNRLYFFCDSDSLLLNL